jgi:RES domain-containing protein
MDVFRICSRIKAPHDSSGEALSSEGRWHQKGQRVLYFSKSLAACVLERRSNGVSFHTIRNFDHFSVAKLSARASMETIPEGFYEEGWQQRKPRTQEFGSKWYSEKRSLVLRVKSAVLPVEVNFIINASHPEFNGITFTDPMAIELDPRLSENEGAEMKRR